VQYYVRYIAANFISEVVYIGPSKVMRTEVRRSIVAR